jgi:hypothetical protein
MRQIVDGRVCEDERVCRRRVRWCELDSANARHGLCIRYAGERRRVWLKGSPMLLEVVYIVQVERVGLGGQLKQRQGSSP